VAVGLGTIVTSPNGIIWAKLTETGKPLAAITYGNSQFVVVGGSYQPHTTGSLRVILYLLLRNQTATAQHAPVPVAVTAALAIEELEAVVPTGELDVAEMW
jgi:hypothetical protein